MTPRFSATKIRPSGAKRTTVGLVRPLSTTVSANPGRVVAPCASDGTDTTASPPATRENADARTHLVRPVRRCGARPATDRPELLDDVANQPMVRPPCRAAGLDVRPPRGRAHP